MYDLIIVGAGPAGVTAAVYAARKRMNFIVVTDDIGGQTTWSGDIENYTGFDFITGTDLVSKFEEHMHKYAIPIHEQEKVARLEPHPTGNHVVVTTEGGVTYEALTTIIASGKRSRELGVPGEKEFRKRGVTYCATCDGPLYGGKDVVVVGGGNSGLEATLQLMKIARHIYLVNNTARLTGDPILRDKIEGQPAVTVLNETAIEEIRGERMVSTVLINQRGRRETLHVQGVFTEIGLIPNSDFAVGIAKNKWNEIIVNNRNMTNVPYIFAAGDVTDVPEKQIIIAAGEGAKACLSAFAYMAYRKEY